MKFPISRERRIVAAVILASTTASHAVPTVVESFLTGAPNYTAGTENLVGQGPATTGLTGSWLAAYGGAQSPGVIAGGLSYTAGAGTVNSAGGAVEYPLGGNGRVGRLLTTAFDNNTAGTIYFAIMIQPDTTGTGYRGFEMHSGGFDDGPNRKLQIVTGESGIAPDASNFAVRLFNNPNNGFAGDLGAVTTAVNFFVGKITFSTNSSEDSISLWRNPSNLTSEGSSGPATFTKSGFDLQLDRVSLARFNGADGFKADEIRFGTTWTDVTTVINNADTDGDGLPDSYEQLIIGLFLDDAVDDLSDVAGPLNAPFTTDFDGDGSSDAQEYARGTSPSNPDSDGDQLLDGVETGTGTFVSEFNTGTNPLDNDSDDDLLRDGDEVNFYLTNPNLADTDGDLENDGTEFFQGTNPFNAASSSSALGLAIIDGIRDNALYSTPLAVQTIQTGFGDNATEWNAAYAYVNAGKLHLLFTGNLAANFNKLEIFIDSVAGGSTTFTSAGNDGSNAMNGMKFDAAFAPDYHLVARRGLSKFELDIANLGTMASSYLPNLFAGSETGRGVSGTGPGNNFPIRVAYDGSNTAGIGGDSGAAADQAAAASVSTGLEIAINLADLGNPSGSVKVMLLQNNNAHNFLSNQSLAGLPITFGNLATPSTADFSAYAGDQFFTVGLSPVHLLAGNSSIRFTAKGLVAGTNYIVQDSTTLANFANVAGSQFTAAGGFQVISLPVTPGTDPAHFFRVKSLP